MRFPNPDHDAYPIIVTTLPGLLENVLLHLEKSGLKIFRRVSRECEALATPHVFDEVPFDLEPGGCDSLAAIARHPRLQRNVRTVRLKRRNGLRDFPDFS